MKYMFLLVLACIVMLLVIGCARPVAGTESYNGQNFTNANQSSSIQNHIQQAEQLLDKVESQHRGMYGSLSLSNDQAQVVLNAASLHIELAFIKHCIENNECYISYATE